MKHFMKNAINAIYGFLSPEKPQRILTNKKKFELFCKAFLFKGISEEYLQKLYSMTYESHLAEGEYLFQEGDASNELFIIIDGAVEITKQDESFQHHRLTLLHAGQSVGEMPLIDHGPRSAAVRAVTATTLFSIPYSAFIEKGNEFTQIYYHISKNITERLRSTNKLTIRALKKQVEEYTLRIVMGKFMINTIVVICLFTFSLAGLGDLIVKTQTTTFVTVPLSLFFIIAFVILIKSTKLPKAVFGVTTHDWKRAAIESILFTLPVLVIMVIIKWVQVHFFTAYLGHPLIEPFASLQFTENMTMNLTGEATADLKVAWIVSLILYSLLIAPAQELIVRGGLQGSLEVFLTGKHKTLVSIFVSNLIFSTVHLYLPLSMAIWAFFPGLFWGWLYSRHKTLIGVTISHVMIGLWGLWVLGMV
ncbi:MAG: cAMP/cGMP binding protein [uncultured bacterium]|nr:MAG: cAMP/cGMP binding protein [uncultured bacterium]